jgi:hypothetical protein
MDCKIVARPVFVKFDPVLPVFDEILFLNHTNQAIYCRKRVSSCLNCSVYRFNFERKIKRFFAVFMVTAKPLGRPSNFYI